MSGKVGGVEGGGGDGQASPGWRQMRVCVEESSNGWMVGWVGESSAGWMDGSSTGWMGGPSTGWLDGSSTGWMSPQLDG